MRRILRAAVLLLVVAAAGCGWSPAPDDQTVGRVTLQVSGGITGWDRTLIVEPDGAARVEAVRGPVPSGTTQVDASTLTRLHSLVSTSEFARLEAAYLPSPGGADLQDYKVTAEVGGKTLTTMSRDGANPPPVLREVLTILNGILARIQNN